jgi:iron complex transport system permease protein
MEAGGTECCGETEMNVLTAGRWIGMNAMLILALAGISVFAVLQGTEPIGLGEAVGILAGHESVDEIKRTILLQVRLPRLLLAGLVGGILAICGAAYQALLRNPLADPFILGVSSGAALGVYLGIVFGLQATILGWMATPVMAFAGGILAVWLVYQIARVGGTLPVTALLLSGVVVNAILSSLMLFLTSVMESGQVLSILMWIMGHIGSHDYSTLAVLAAYTVIGGGGLMFFAKPLNLLALGDEQATGLGLPIERTKKILLLLTTFLTGVAVSVSGIIGFVGMMIPHGVRMMTGSDHRLLLPASFIVGAAFLILADTLARNLLRPGEIPLGVLTALCGGPFFLALLKTSLKQRF